jgi:hypothetical protein
MDHGVEADHFRMPLAASVAPQVECEHAAVCAQPFSGSSPLAAITGRAVEQEKPGLWPLPTEPGKPDGAAPQGDSTWAQRAAARRSASTSPGSGASG